MTLLCPELLSERQQKWECNTIELWWDLCFSPPHIAELPNGYLIHWTWILEIWLHLLKYFTGLWICLGCLKEGINPRRHNLGIWYSYSVAQILLFKWNWKICSLGAIIERLYLLQSSQQLICSLEIKGRLYKISLDRNRRQRLGPNCMPSKSQGCGFRKLPKATMKKMKTICLCILGDDCPWPVD